MNKQVNGRDRCHRKNDRNLTNDSGRSFQYSRRNRRQLAFYQGNYSTYMYVRPNGEFSSTYFKPVQKNICVKKASQEMDSLLKVKHNPSEFKQAIRNYSLMTKDLSSCRLGKIFVGRSSPLNSSIVDNVRVEPFHSRKISWFVPSDDDVRYPSVIIWKPAIWFQDELYTL
jgi:hypothetical protein